MPPEASETTFSIYSLKHAMAQFAVYRENINQCKITLQIKDLVNLVRLNKISN